MLYRQISSIYTFLYIANKIRYQASVHPSALRDEHGGPLVASWHGFFMKMVGNGEFTAVHPQKRVLH